MTEAQIISEAADDLRRNGRVTIEYITAEFAPFSDQFRPDLLFVSNSTPGSVYFVEFRLTRNVHWRTSSDMLRQLAEHKDFVSAGATGVRYAFASDCTLSQSSITLLLENGIEFLGPIDSGHSLAEKILDWCNRTSPQNPQC